MLVAAIVLAAVPAAPARAADAATRRRHRLPPARAEPRRRLRRDGRGSPRRRSRPRGRRSASPPSAARRVARDGPLASRRPRRASTTPATSSARSSPSSRRAARRGARAGVNLVATLTRRRRSDGSFERPRQPHRVRDPRAARGRALDARRRPSAGRRAGSPRQQNRDGGFNFAGAGRRAASTTPPARSRRSSRRDGRGAARSRRAAGVPRAQPEPRRRLPAAARVGGRTRSRRPGRSRGWSRPAATPRRVRRGGSRTPLGVPALARRLERQRPLLAHERPDAGLGHGAGADRPGPAAVPGSRAAAVAAHRRADRDRAAVPIPSRPHDRRCPQGDRRRRAPRRARPRRRQAPRREGRRGRRRGRRGRGRADPRRAVRGGRGATIGDPWGADVVVKVAPPDRRRRSPSSATARVLVGFLAPLTSPETTRALADAGVTAFAMEAIPRISPRAVDGRAVVAVERRRLQGGAARRRALDALLPDADDRGGHDPAGEGARARRRRRRPAGARDRAAPRARGRRATTSAPEVAEQVQSLGAKWLDLGIEAAGEGGYARELTEEERAQQQQALTDAIKDFDVVITTALVPGRRAPTLVTAEAVEGMKPGTVDRRPRRRGGRQLRADRAGRGRGQARRHDRLAAEPADDDARARVASSTRATCSRCSS